MLTEKQSVTVTDIDMPFRSMVRFMVKWAFAAIPAIIIVSLVLTFISLLAVPFLKGLLGGLNQVLGS